MVAAGGLSIVEAAGGQGGSQPERPTGRSGSDTGGSSLKRRNKDSFERLLPDHLGIVAVGESDHIELGQLVVRHVGESECRVVR